MDFELCDFHVKYGYVYLSGTDFRWYKNLSEGVSTILFNSKAVPLGGLPEHFSYHR